MELKLMTPEEYSSAFDRWVPHIYNTAAFNELNRDKAGHIHYVAFCVGGVPQAGIILGEKDSCMHSPFSAPFGGFTVCPDATSESVRMAVRTLYDFCLDRRCSLEITLPPAIYAPGLVETQLGALAEYGSVEWTDVNYHRPLDFAPGETDRAFNRNARARLRQALAGEFSFRVLDAASESDVRRFYNVISANHSALGYPVRMSFEQVLMTAPLVGSRFMMLSREGIDVAAVMINNVTDRVCQLIYWGDLLQFRPLRPMNMLAYHLFEMCRRWGYDVIDMGPASYRGVPSPGLCRFKESLGCIATPKYTLKLAAAKQCTGCKC